MKCIQPKNPILSQGPNRKCVGIRFKLGTLTVLTRLVSKHGDVLSKKKKLVKLLQLSHPVTVIRTTCCFSYRQRPNPNPQMGIGHVITQVKAVTVRKEMLPKVSLRRTLFCSFIKYEESLLLPFACVLSILSVCEGELQCDELSYQAVIFYLLSQHSILIANCNEVNNVLNLSVPGRFWNVL